MYSPTNKFGNLFCVKMNALILLFSNSIPFRRFRYFDLVTLSVLLSRKLLLHTIL